ncbi:uncharacterized protein LOC144172793 [Haemaphysalis longicornis]
MITHAYVRYEDDKRFAIVEVDDIKGFNPEDDFEGTFYNTKWTDDSGASDYYRSRILLVADSEARLKAKIAGRRVRVRRLPSSDSDSDDEIVEGPKRKKGSPREDLLDILAKKRRALGLNNRPKNTASHDELAKAKDELAKAKEECAQLHQLVAKQAQELEDMEGLKAQILHLRGTLATQGQELDELRRLNRRIQWRLVGGDDTDGPSTTRRPPQQPASTLPQPADALLQPGPLPQPADALPEPADPLPQPEGQLLPILPTAPERKVDIGKGLLVPCGAWQRIQTREKDSLFVKDLLVTVWDPAVLKSRSLNGRPCPRFPDRPKKQALTPWKLAVIRDCYKQRLQQRGVPPEVMPAMLKQVNHFLVEKIADVERTARKLEMK